MASPFVASSWTPPTATRHSSRSYDMDVDNSVLIHRSNDDPPSSPFVSKLEFKSREASRAWAGQIHDYNDGEIDSNEKSVHQHFETSMKGSPKKKFVFEEDKENATGESLLISKVPASKSRSPMKRFGEKVRNERGELEPQRSSRPESMLSASARGMRMTPKKIHPDTLESALSVAHASQRDEHSSDSSDIMDKSVLVHHETTNIDDTCFSTFSEVPESTLFSKITHSPSKQGESQRTPRRAIGTTPHTGRKRASPSRSPSPTPRRLKTTSQSHNDEGTSFLIDFTQQIENVDSHRSNYPQKSATEPDLLTFMNRQRSPHKSSRTVHATPQKQNNILNLLDFELPPAPTPRSIPTITVRELEGLKSSYLSQISSLKATLSGREAEVNSLKRAVADAERRVGEAQEALGEEVNRREHVEREKAGWEERGKEVEAVLLSVKEEVIKGDAEKEDMLKKMEDLEHKLSNAEQRAIKAEERCDEILAARISAAENSNSTDGGASNAEEVQRLVAIQIDSKIEAVSRELHAVYKDKHERKVATLKKSYEARGEKKCAELRDRVADLEKQNEDLLAKKDATFSDQINHVVDNVAEFKTEIEEHKAAIARIKSELQTSRDQQTQLMRELQQERIEKGDLVAAVDEMLALQSEQGGSTQVAMSVVEDFRKSIATKPSGLRTPAAGLGESRIGRFAGSGLPKSSGLPGKSKMLANIERMGSRVGSNSSMDSQV